MRLNTVSTGLLARYHFQNYNSEHIVYIINSSKMDMPTNFEVQVQDQQKGNWVQTQVLKIFVLIYYFIIQYFSLY